MCKGSLKGSKLQFGFETHLVRRPLHDAPDDCHPESDLKLSCLLQLLLNCVSQPWRHLMLPHGCPSVQFARVQVMRRLCSTLPTFTHVTLSSCVVVAKWQLAAGVPATFRLLVCQSTLFTCPTPVAFIEQSLASLIKLGRSDCHWEIARLQLSYSLCENSFTLARFSFFFMPAQMPSISSSSSPSSP